MRQVKTTFLSELNQFLLTKETVTDSWRIDTSLWATGDAGLNWNSDLVETVLIWSVTAFSQGLHKDIREIWMLKVNQKAPGNCKMRCKFIMETIEFFKSKTEKKRDRKSITKPRKHTMKQHDLLARQSVVFWKILASFLLTAMKAIKRTTPRGGNLPLWCNGPYASLAAMFSNRVRHFDCVINRGC